MDDGNLAAVEGARMITAKATHPLSYFAVVLAHMTGTLRDFDMPETAALLERAKSDIEQELAKDPEKSVAGETRNSVREDRQH